MNDEAVEVVCVVIVNGETYGIHRTWNGAIADVDGFLTAYPGDWVRRPDRPDMLGWTQARWTRLGFVVDLVRMELEP